jgi:hypothetical protein
MALVNAFIVFREAQKQRGEVVATLAQFLCERQAQLLHVWMTLMYIIQHVDTLTKFPEWTQVREGIRKRPQHQCKVCSIRKKMVGQRRTSRFYCEACSDDNKR